MGSFIGVALLSPVPSFTSKPTPSPPKPPIFLIPYLFLFRLLSSYLPCSDSVHPCFPFCPTLSYCHAIVNHVVPYPSCSRIMCWFNLMSVQSLLPPNSGTRSRSAPWLRTPPVFKSAVSIDTNQSDYFVFAFTFVSLRSSSFHCFLSSFCIPPPTNSLTPDFCPTPVSDLLRNYRTYPLIVRVGATHKLKPSPTRYPLPRIPLTQLRPSSEPSNSGLPPESTPNRHNGNVI